MKVNKTQALMLILKMLLEDGFITKENTLYLLDITDLQFRRYMQELRAFLYNFNSNCELKYSKSEERYYLVKCD